MSENLDCRKLSELRVVDLRSELDKRGLDKSGVKKDLVERLQKALLSEKLDPETYNFDLSDSKAGKRLSTSSSSLLGDDSGLSEKFELENAKEENSNNMNIMAGSDQEALPTNRDEYNRDSHESESVLQVEEDNLNPKATADDPKLEETDGNTTVSSPKVTTQVNEEEVKETTTSDTATQQAPKIEDGDTAIGGNLSSDNPTTEDNSQQQQQKKTTNPKLLWITNVPKNTRANELKQLLSSCGKVVCAKVVVNARFPGSCCFGYVTMGSADDAVNVISKLNNTEFNGQIIKIDKFENIKAENLNPVKKKTEENKKVPVGGQNEEKPKKSVEGVKPKNDEEQKNEDKKSVTGRDSVEKKDSRISSDRSSRGRKRTPSGERLPVTNSGASHHSDVLTFNKIKEERERQRMRDRERAVREENRRRHEEEQRLREMREIARRQKFEADRLEREREKLRIEREKIEREKTELIKLERERQKLEREKLEMEKMELQRTRMRLEEDRRATKRPPPVSYRRDDVFEQPDNRKRPNNNRHFEAASSSLRFEPPTHPKVAKFPVNQTGTKLKSEPIPTKKFAPAKDFKRFPYEKHESYPDKRNRDYNSERPHQSQFMGRNTAKFDRGYERPAPTAPIRKESKYERDRSPHFRPMGGESRDRHIPQGKPDREHYSESNGRWNSMNQSKSFGSNSSKPWNSKGGSWRSDPPTSDRWNPGSNSSRGSMNQQFSMNSNSATCPPPPGMNSYSERFEYNKPAGRKY